MASLIERDGYLLELAQGLLAQECHCDQCVGEPGGPCDGGCACPVLEDADACDGRPRCVWLGSRWRAVLTRRYANTYRGDEVRWFRGFRADDDTGYQWAPDGDACRITRTVDLFTVVAEDAAVGLLVLCLPDGQAPDPALGTPLPVTAPPGSTAPGCRRWVLVTSCESRYRASSGGVDRRDSDCPAFNQDNSPAPQSIDDTVTGEDCRVTFPGNELELAWLPGRRRDWEGQPPGASAFITYPCDDPVDVRRFPDSIGPCRDGGSAVEVTSYAVVVPEPAGFPRRHANTNTVERTARTGVRTDTVCRATPGGGEVCIPTGICWVGGTGQPTAFPFTYSEHSASRRFFGEASALFSGFSLLTLERLEDGGCQARTCEAVRAAVPLLEAERCDLPGAFVYIEPASAGSPDASRPPQSGDVAEVRLLDGERVCARLSGISVVLEPSEAVVFVRWYPESDAGTPGCELCVNRSERFEPCDPDEPDLWVPVREAEAVRAASLAASGDANPWARSAWLCGRLTGERRPQAPTSPSVSGPYGSCEACGADWPHQAERCSDGASALVRVPRGLVALPGQVARVDGVCYTLTGGRAPGTPVGDGDGGPFQGLFDTCPQCDAATWAEVRACDGLGAGVVPDALPAAFGVPPEWVRDLPPGWVLVYRVVLERCEDGSEKRVLFTCYEPTGDFVPPGAAYPPPETAFENCSADGCDRIETRRCIVDPPIGQPGGNFLLAAGGPPPRGDRPGTRGFAAGGFGIGDVL